MSLSAKLKSIIEVAFANKKYGDELSTAVDALIAAGPTTVSPSVIDNILTFSSIVGACQDSGVAIGAIAAAQADATIAKAYKQAGASVNLAGSAPTSAQCIAAFGAIATQSGQAHVMLDSSDATKTYVCASDGVAWFQIALTKTI